MSNAPEEQQHNHHADDSSTLTAGRVIIQRFDEVAYTVIVHRPKHRDWSIPKGKVDPGESLEETAIREIQEETVLEGTLGDYLGTQYFPDDDKLAHHWIMDVVTDHGFRPHAEVDALRWVPLEDAPAAVDQHQDRDLIAKAMQYVDSVS